MGQIQFMDQTFCQHIYYEGYKRPEGKGKLWQFCSLPEYQGEEKYHASDTGQEREKKKRYKRGAPECISIQQRYCQGSNKDKRCNEFQHGTKG